MEWGQIFILDFPHIFHASFLLAPGFLPENEEIFSFPLCKLLIGICLFYENWSTETFRRQESLSEPAECKTLCYTCHQQEHQEMRQEGVEGKICQTEHFLKAMLRISISRILRPVESVAQRVIWISLP